MYMVMPDGPYTHMRRALIHGTTPGMKLLHFGGQQYPALRSRAGSGRSRGSRERPDEASRPMVDLMQAKRSTLHEVIVRPPPDVAP